MMPFLQVAISEGKEKEKEMIFGTKSLLMVNCALVSVVVQR